MKRFISFVMTFLLLVTIVPVSDVHAADLKSFTLREQKGSEDVNVIYMEKGDSVDLRFIGVANWRSYKLTWSSSNTKVATVAQSGLIKAVGNGVCDITLSANKDYAPSSVKIIVGDEPTNYVCTSVRDIFLAKEVSVGDKLSLKVSGVAGNTDFYSLSWSSSDSKIATITNDGKISFLSEGVVVVKAKVLNKLTSTKVNDVEATFYVGGTSVSVNPTTKPVITPTVKPTDKPLATATPIPTATPVPTEIPVALDFEPVFTSASTVELRFNQSVNFNNEDITIKYGNKLFDDCKLLWNSDKTLCKVTFVDDLKSGTSLSVFINGFPKNKTAKLTISKPDRAVLTYYTLGKEGIAYTNTSSNIDFDIYTILGCRLYCGEVDVTDTYISDCYITYESVSADENVDFTGEELTFYKSDATAVVKAIVNYWDSKGVATILESEPVPITAKSAPTYNVGNVIEWTVVKKNSYDKVDWSAPVHEVIAGSDDQYQIICLISDNYGYLYSTDTRGISAADKIYATYDSATPLSFTDFSLYFEVRDSDCCYISGDGSVSAFDKDSNVTVLVYNGNTSISALPLKCLEPRKVSKLVSQDSKLTVSTDSEYGDDDIVCKSSTVITAFDQYDSVWNGDIDYEISCNNSDLRSNLTGGYGSPAYMDGNTFVVDGRAISSITKSSNIKFTIKDTESGKSVSVSVIIKTPQYDSTNNIVVTGWDLGDPKTYDIALTNEDISSLEKSFYVDIFKTSKNSTKIGVYKSQVFVQASNNTKYTASNCTEGDIYVTITSPSGKLLANATGKQAIGYKVDDTGRIKVVAGIGDTKTPNAFNCIEEGTYTVRAVYIKKSDGSNVVTEKKSTTFEVVNSTKEVSFRGIKDTECSYAITSADDAKYVVGDLFMLNLDGEYWEEFNSSMIESVKYTYKNNLLTVTSITLVVPYDYNHGFYGYKVTLNGLNKTIKIVY